MSTQDILTVGSLYTVWETDLYHIYKFEVKPRVCKCDTDLTRTLLIYTMHNRENRKNTYVNEEKSLSGIQIF